MMKVRNMVSSSSGREVANQFVISGDSKIIFQSYDSTICVIDHNKEGAEHITLGAHWDYSKTTAKYLYQFLKEFAGMYNLNKKAIETAINNREVTYNANLC